MPSAKRSGGKGSSKHNARRHDNNSNHSNASHNDQTPVAHLLRCIDKGYLDAVERLLASNSANIDAEDSIVFRRACSLGHAKIAHLLLEWNVDSRSSCFGGHTASHVHPGSCDDEALRHAAAAGHVRVVELLLGDERVHACARDSEALRDAAREGHHEVVSLLLSHCDPSARDQYAIRWACKRGWPEVVRRLLDDERVDARCQQYIALHNAVVHGHLEVVATLLQHFYNTDLLSIEGQISAPRGTVSLKNTDRKQSITATFQMEQDSIADHLQEDVNGTDSRAVIRGQISPPQELFSFFEMGGKRSVTDSFHKTEEPSVTDILRVKHSGIDFANLAVQGCCEIHATMGPIVQVILKYQRVFGSMQNLVNDWLSRALIEACRLGQTETVKVILQDGRVDVRQLSSTAVLWAARLHNETIAKNILCFRDVAFRVQDLMPRRSYNTFIKRCHRAVWIDFCVAISVRRKAGTARQFQPVLPDDVLRVVFEFADI